jgi:hypothetical protein
MLQETTIDFLISYFALFLTVLLCAPVVKPSKVKRLQCFFLLFSWVRSDELFSQQTTLILLRLLDILNASLLSSVIRTRLYLNILFIRENTPIINE